MKKVLVIMCLLVVAMSYGQDLKSMATSTATSKVLNNDYIDKLASDQVKKLTKKFNLSESQQTQATDLVMKQLRSDKFQSMLSKYTPEQLMSSEGSDNITKALMGSDSFKKDMGGMLDDEQKKAMKKANLPKY
ncbi:hypothetical protein [Winogradskyella aurantiaca]|uniref:hypothetical protein n=1 Tax=Winogradskyella aurantiaca TaxID=2219558 RepID=UPI000E1C7E76|nr:hypothetical protein [Winogradskyella aurantiaca]